LAVIGGFALAPPLVLAITAPRDFRFRDAATPIYVAGVAFGHVAGGGYGWFERYDVYALAVGLAGLFYIYRPWWRWILGRMARPAGHPAGRFAGSVTFLAAVLCFAGAIAIVFTQNKAHWRISLISHAAAYNIYEQQGQMSRFVREFYRGPVVVNDLGYVAWRNPYYVLDLMGLGSEEVRRMRNDGIPPARMLTELGARHEVGLAMAYAAAVPPGIDWVPMAYLRLGTPRITPASNTVVFLRTRQGSTEKIDRALREFETILPPGVMLDRWPACGRRTTLAALGRSLPEGAPLHSPGATRFLCPLTVDFEGPRLVSKVFLQANNDGLYLLRMMNNGIEVAYMAAPGNPLPGLRTRVVDIAPVIADSVVLEALGHNQFAVGYLNVVGEID
jgi:hypothetical protein